MKDLARFLQRVATIVRGAMTGRADEFGRLLDPTETVEPRTVLRLSRAARLPVSVAF